jgi:hypothetical protein
MSTAEVDMQDKVQLTGGFTLEILIEYGNVTFQVMNTSDNVAGSIQVCPPIPQHDSWRRAWDPELDEPEFAFLELGTSYGRRRMPPACAQAYSEAVSLAADFCYRLNEQAAEALAHQEYERRDVRERQQREQEAEAAKRAELQESIQWYIGQKFKLKRKGYRATVFGTINRVTDRTIYTTSERDIPMETNLVDLTELHIMYEGDKRYTKVFPA